MGWPAQSEQSCAAKGRGTIQVIHICCSYTCMLHDARTTCQEIYILMQEVWFPTMICWALEGVILTLHLLLEVLKQSHVVNVPSK